MKPIELIKQYKYQVGGVIVFLIGYYIYYKVTHGASDDDKPVKETKVSDISKVNVGGGGATQAPRVNPSDLQDLQALIKIFTSEMKKSSESMIQFNTDKMKTNNYLNMRNNLFTKDIIMTKLLVDSKSLNHEVSFDPSNFTVNLGGSNEGDYPNSYKNVIGFRLLKCSVPVRPYHVTDGQNIITITYPSTTTATIDYGSYTGDSLAVELTNKISTVLDSSPTATVTFDATNLKFTLVSSSGRITIDWSKSPLLAKILGFYAFEKDFNESASSDFVGDFNISFVDLVIPEIPMIACKDNSKGKPIIDRIPLVQNSSDSSISYYQTNSSEYFTQNYFYPMKLATLSISLYLDSKDDIIYDSQKGETNFEFELTILKNTKLMDEKI